MGNGVTIRERISFAIGAAAIVSLPALFVGAYWAALKWSQLPGPAPVLGILAALLAVWGPWSLYLIVTKGEPVPPALTALAGIASALLFGAIWWLSLEWTADDSAHVEISFLSALGATWLPISAFSLWRKSRGRD